MTFEQIERIAFERGIMPDGADLTEHSCYQAMAYLYSRYRSGVITRDRAKVEKKDIRAEFERNVRRDRIYAEEERRYRRIRGMLSDIEKHGSEDAKRLIRIMDGRERIIEEDCNESKVQQSLQSYQERDSHDGTTDS